MLLLPCCAWYPDQSATLCRSPDRRGAFPLTCGETAIAAPGLQTRAQFCADLQIGALLFPRPAGKRRSGDRLGVQAAVWRFHSTDSRPLRPFPQAGPTPLAAPERGAAFLLHCPVRDDDRTPTEHVGAGSSICFLSCHWSLTRKEFPYHAPG